MAELSESHAEQRTNKLFTFSNFLSVLRILLVAPFIYFFERDEKVIAFIIVLLAISTDWLDGRVARWTNTVSDMGKILDPLADKLCGALMAMYFSWRGDVPIWFMVFLVTRDVTIFLGGVYAKHTRGIITTALPAGKWAVGFLALMFVALVFPNPPFDAVLLKDTCMWIAAVLLFVSFAQYTIRFVNILQGKYVVNL
jgi:CDP-diacylglycerol--glycerol-3-phosphate 3-phosphatidyltransferase